MEGKNHPFKVVLYTRPWAYMHPHTDRHVHTYKMNIKNQVSISFQCSKVTLNTSYINSPIVNCRIIECVIYTMTLKYTLCPQPPQIFIFIYFFLKIRTYLSSGSCLWSPPILHKSYLRWFLDIHSYHWCKYWTSVWASSTWAMVGNANSGLQTASKYGHVLSLWVPIFHTMQVGLTAATPPFLWLFINYLG